MEIMMGVATYRILLQNIELSHINKMYLLSQDL